ncbi:glycosyltransferase family 4 protein [Grimontia sp. NTOU-MAR1]|uniref:glycosyltransferase family 4 protein n=1 Tax=Grimontia sp. NTOU-MAR1 TaxID=3111011 RepID=UPI002DBD5A36|nr:glycosyltransferase family 4 protein [Grimontia sp. NTOU-MAR1]WRV97594.1 glycosyltransferase family 4 protein [Grimontia sp. NTOU-MAR1]
MKLLFVISAFSVGGTEVKIKNIANYLVENSLAEVDILCLSNVTKLKKELSPKIRFVVIDGTGGFREWLTCRKQINSFLLKNPNYDKTFWLNYYPILMAPKSKHRKIAMLNTSTVYGLSQKIKKHLAERNLKHFDKIILGNKSLSKALATRHPQTTSKISEIYNGVDINRYTYHPKQINTSKAMTLCMVAKLRPEKRHLDVLQSVTQLNEEGVDIKLLIVGGEHKSFVEYAESLEKYCKDNAIEHLVDFIGDTNSVNSYLLKADLFLIPSHETFSNAVLEAMACGTPVLGANIGGNAELIEDNETGYFHTYRDISNITERILEIHSNLEQLSLVSKNARQLIETKFSFEKMVSNYLQA